MNCKLLSHTQEPLRVFYEATNIYNYAEPNSNYYGYNKALKRLNNIVESGHTSALEHISFTFMLEDISLVACTHILRHRIASYSQLSRRNVDNGFKFIIPDRVVDMKQDNYANLNHQRYYEMFETALEFYKNEIKRGVKPEDARYILPQGLATNLSITMNMRSLLNFFEQRLCKRTMQETRDIATKMKYEVIKVFPEIQPFIKTKCEKGICSEKVKCGSYD